MKYKNMMLAALLLLAILTMGAVSASEDADTLAVSDDVGDIEVQAPAADEILTDNSTFIVNDEGGDEGDDNPYNVEIVDEFDFTKENLAILNITCPEDEQNNYFVFKTLNDDWQEFHSYDYQIKGSDHGNVIHITPLNLGISEPGGYIILIFSTNTPDDLKEGEEIYESWRGIEAIDYSQFRYISMDTFEPSALFMGDIFAVYCPDGSSGKVYVDVRKEGDDEFFKTSQKDVTDKDDENKLYWALSEFDIREVGLYRFSIYHQGFNGGSYDDIKEDEIDVVSPVSIDASSYIYSPGRGGLVFAEIPSNFEDGEIWVMIDGELKVNKTLSEFVEGDGNSPYWRYSEGHGGTDESNKWYYINNYHFDYDFEGGQEYVITAILSINQQSGTISFTEEEEVRMINRNIVSDDDGHSIEIFGENGYWFEDWIEIIAITAPEGSDGTVEIWVDDYDDGWRWEGPLDELSYFIEEENQYFIVPGFFEDLDSGEHQIFVAYKENGKELIRNSGFIEFYGDEDEPIDDIEFHIIADDDEEDAIFEIGKNTVIGELLVPASEEFEEMEIYVTFTKNGQNYAIFLIDRTDSEDQGEFIEDDNIYKYEIPLDLTGFMDKDILEFTLDGSFMKDQDPRRYGVWTYAIEIDEDIAIFHWYEEGVQSYVFVGNITKEDFNNPHMMGPHPEGRFIELGIPESYEGTEGSIVVSDDSGVLYEKSLDDLDDITFDYSNLGNRYIVSLDDYNLMNLPENKVITVTLNFGSDSLTFKRIRHGDYLSQIVTPDDVAKLYDVTINEDVMTSEDDTAVSIVGLDANPQTIWIYLGEGQFNVYVNDQKVEGLGNLIFENWMNNNGILDADLEELYEMDLGEMEIPLEEFVELSKDEKISILKKEFPDDITLFRLTNFRHGCPELYISLADLNITDSGEYNIKVTHIPGVPEEISEEEDLPDYITERVETLVLEKNVTVTYPFVSVSADDIRGGEDAVIVATLQNGINGNVHFTVNGVTGKASIVNGVATYTVSGLNVGSYEVSARFNGNKKYSAQTVTTKFNVLKPSPFISVSPVTVKYGVDATFTVNLASDVPGNVRFALKGDAGEKAKITNGVATYTFSGLKYGLYYVDISYAGNYKYAADMITTTLKVNKNSPIVSVVANDIVYKENATITVNLAQNVPGNVHVTLGNVTQKAKITDSVATATFTGLKCGTYDVKVAYAGNVNYVAQTKTTSFKVVKGTPIISVDAPDVVYGEDAVITVNLCPDVPGNAWFTINGVTERTPITKGTATYSISGLRSGTYDVNVMYKGNIYYNAQNYTTTLKVVKGTPIKSISVKNNYVGRNTTITVNMASNVNGFVKITINGNTERVQIVNGVAALTVSGLKAGTYDVSAVYAGNANFDAQTFKSNLTVNKLSPGISILKSTVNKIPVITVKLAEDAPGNVWIKVNGSQYKVPITNGVASISLPDLKSGSHVVEAKYNGNYKYLAQTKTKTVSVK